MRKSVFVATLLLGWSALAAGETAYVTDSLRLGLHAASDTSDRPFENLVSGTAVEVLERNPNYARVKLADGREGWVKATYLVEPKPAAARVAELEAAIAGLKDEAASARAAQAAAEQALAQHTAALQATTGSAETIQQTVARLQDENRAYEERLEAYRHSLPMTWVIPALVVVLVAGFFGGLWWLDALIRRRHGGFRVY